MTRRPGCEWVLRLRVVAVGALPRATLREDGRDQLVRPVDRGERFESGDLEVVGPYTRDSGPTERPHAAAGVAPQPVGGRVALFRPREGAVGDGALAEVEPLGVFALLADVEGLHRAVVAHHSGPHLALGDLVVSRAQRARGLLAVEVAVAGADRERGRDGDVRQARGLERALSMRCFVLPRLGSSTYCSRCAQDAKDAKEIYRIGCMAALATKQIARRA